MEHCNTLSLALVACTACSRCNGTLQVISLFFKTEHDQFPPNWTWIVTHRVRHVKHECDVSHIKRGMSHINASCHASMQASYVRF